MNAQPDWIAITQRLCALERQNRRMKLAVLALLVALGCGSLMAAAEFVQPPAIKGRTAEVLDCKKLILRDSDAKVRYQLEVDDKGTVVQKLLDAAGTDRLVLSVEKTDKAWVILKSKPKEDRAAIVVDKDGTAGMILADADRPRIGSFVFHDGAAIIDLSDKQGGNRITMAVDQNGNAAQGLADKTGKDRFKIMTDPDGNASMQLNGTTGENRFGWGTQKNGNAFQLITGGTGSNSANLVTVTVPDKGVAQLFSQGGKVQVGTVVKSDGTAQHFVAKSAAAEALDLARTAREIYGVVRDAKDVYDYFKKK